MGRSILNIRLSVKPPYVLNTIPLTTDYGGLPFVYETPIKADRWYLVEKDTGIEMALDTAFILFDKNIMYYNADLNLIDIVRGLGYNPTCSKYYYKFKFSGTTRYSKEFKINVNISLPEPEPLTGRSFSTAFSRSFG
jgi:hypothetical protein